MAYYCTNDFVGTSLSCSGGMVLFEQLTFRQNVNNFLVKVIISKSCQINLKAIVKKCNGLTPLPLYLPR